MRLVGIPELAGPKELGHALASAADPELARVAVSRLGDDPAGRALLARVDVFASAILLVGFSSAATDFFVAHPEELACLADLRPRTLDDLTAEAGSDVHALGPADGLRRFRRRASYRLAARDLAGAPVDDVMAELTAVAEACLRTAVDAVERSVGASGELAVIGMGKLGGRELNYSSDVDVLFVHREPGPDAGRRASRAAAGVIALVTEPTGEGIALRVDPNLRPEGRSGPLSRSLDAMAEYYGRHAATWERQALLKARPVAGDLALGARFVEAVTPFVYPAVLPASSVDEVRASKVRIEEHVRALGKETTEVKRGRGGIRDVEFAVQLLQLVHGRRHPELREAGTLPALEALASEGFVAPSDAEALATSYRFLRALEHRLQMARDLQTHELPPDRRSLETLARSMGLSGGPDHLRAEHERHTSAVRGLHERLFYRPLLEAFADAHPRAGVDHADTQELLAGLGYADPPGAYRAFGRVVDPGTRLGKVLGALFPVVVHALASAAAPDAAVVRFERVTDAMKGSGDPAFADRLAGRPDAARRLAALVGASSAFADTLVANPGLATAAFELPPAERPLFPDDPQAELLRVAAAHATRELVTPDLGRRLTAVADGVLARALAEEDPPVPMALIGLGKLGREELSFASDLDVMVVFDGDGAEDFRAAARAAERLMDRARADGWQVDPDLRPEGRSGPLARSMSSYLEYWQRWAETWEYQALLGARFVAGDELLGRRFLSNASDFAYPEALTLEQVVAIRRMRVRMEEERARPAEARRFHLKLGYGGLADVQFAVELSLMRHGFEHPEVRRRHTLEALEALSAARLLEDSVALSLGDGYVFLTEIKNAMEIERRLPAEALPPSPESQGALARRLGYEQRSRQRFLEDYRRITRKVRLAMERVFYGEEA